jgi:hypothetical protein
MGADPAFKDIMDAAVPPHQENAAEDLKEKRMALLRFFDGSTSSRHVHHRH